MSLCKLPDTGYKYLRIEQSGQTFIWKTGTDEKDEAQFWIDSELDEKIFVPAVWWKFWKPTITFRVFAYGWVGRSFSQVIKVQEK